jgi:hypothetical protein
MERRKNLLGTPSIACFIPLKVGTAAKAPQIPGPPLSALIEGLWKDSGPFWGGFRMGKKTRRISNFLMKNTRKNNAAE